jgi:hypothetical protein
MDLVLPEGTDGSMRILPPQSRRVTREAATTKRMTPKPSFEVILPVERSA